VHRTNTGKGGVSGSRRCLDLAVDYPSGTAALRSGRTPAVPRPAQDRRGQEAGGYPLGHPGRRTLAPGYAHTPEPDALLFTSPTGKPLQHGNFRRRVWVLALAASGVDIHLHDLRRTGNGLVAEAGANLRELMERMGHSTSRAALIYLHSNDERQHTLADAVAARVQSELGQTTRDI
jgi:integrase